jgi:glucosamine--fructose-6-phosphate aminotransferase (isomerizing)
MTDSGARSEIRVLQDLKRLGARTLILAEDASQLEHLAPDYLIEIGSGMDEWERAPLYLPPLQHLAYRRATAKGLDPDRPRNLTAVVELQPDGSAA